MFPPNGSLSKRYNSVDPGRHSFDFGLAFPSVDQEDLFCSKCESELPPNFSFATEGIKAAVCYQVRVVVERDGFLKPKITQEQPVQYKPLLPFFYSTAQTEWNAIGRIDLPISYPDGKGIRADESLLHQASVVTLEVKLPGPKILRPGNLANVTICLIIPPELRHFFTPTWIFGISIRLKARTVVTAATQIRAHIGYIDVCNVQAILPVQMTSDESFMMLPSALWEHCIYPAAIPTFQFCDAERTYQLAVTVDFACSKATNRLVGRRSCYITCPSLNIRRKLLL